MSLGFSKSLKTALVPAKLKASIEVRVSMPSLESVPSLMMIEYPDSTALYSEIKPLKETVSVPAPPSIVSLPPPPSRRFEFSSPII